MITSIQRVNKVTSEFIDVFVVTENGSNLSSKSRVYVAMKLYPDIKICSLNKYCILCGCN